MAGDWIKMRRELRDDPAVISIAAQTGLDAYAVVGRLHQVWSWADAHTIDGNAAGVTKTWLDSSVCCTGFAEAMQNVGWLEPTPGGISFPNFSKHNGQTGKVRALTKNRVEVFRNGSSVTKSLPEKRREEKSIKEDSPNGESKKGACASKFIKPAFAEIEAYCLERGGKVDPQEWLDHYEANGWRVGRNPMRDWKATIRGWEKNNFKTIKGTKNLVQEQLAAYDKLQDERDDR